MSMWRGRAGERRVARSLWWGLSSKVYRRFHNVIVPTSHGTTQIDHIVVSPYGVFVIETKNREGWIFGSQNDATWTQVLYKRKYQFQNPLRQTFRQTKSLSEALNMPHSSFHPVVVFAGNCRFKTAMPANVLRSRPSRFIRGFQEPLLSPDDQRRIANQIASFKANRRLTNRAHVKSLQERHGARTICPRCGSQLVERTARKGPRPGSMFLGCTAYPGCRFTRDV